MSDYSRADLLALTPARYLADGCLATDGSLRPQLRSLYATAAATQFAVAELAPQELEFTLEAIRQLLMSEPGTPADQVRHAAEGALEIVQQMIRQPNNPGLAAWLTACVAPITTEAEIAAFLEHGLAALRQYTIVVASLTARPEA